MPSLRLNRPYNKSSLSISCCSPVSKKGGTSASDLKPVVERWPEYIPHKLPDKNYVRVFDTTLRDGEQAPGGALTPPQKLEIARQLAKLRVDIMEVGFPVSSEEEFETVKTIAKTVGNEVDEETGYVPVICAIARSKPGDIEAAWKAVKYAKRPKILIFTSTSDIHMKYKLEKTKEEVIEMAASSVRFAKSLGFVDVQLGCEDGGRSEKEFLCKILGESIKAGATTVNVADTVGINMPEEYGELVSYLKANTPGIDDVIFSVHCHNDLGVATANTIAGVCAGARQVEVTVNGIGERSGNAPLEEVVMALKCRGEYLMDGVYTRIDTRQIMATSQMVQEYTGLSEKEFLCKILGESIKAGATTVNVADTVGINMPEEYGELVSYLKANTPGIDDVIFSVHCHNDLGVATANTIAGVCAGARQVEVTVNGIGERSGNAPLEEVVMALKCRGEYLMDGVYTRIDTRQIMATSQMVQEYTGLYVQPHKPIVGANCFVHESGIHQVQEYTGLYVQPHKPIVGANCFVHESGIHQDGILKNRSTYEILSPEDVGVVKSQGSSIVLGKLSGRHAVKDRLKGVFLVISLSLGYELDDEKLNDIFSMFRDLTKQKKRITDDDLKALVTCRDEVTSLNGATGEETNGYVPISQISFVVPNL
ncbi:hypothetical protein F2Q70_00032478 [Brassica cretica]|uniref:methylthioalkylmalate synthase n=1 Tax=Brassica cretica TaxID=69181 RepID=A0A8S9FLA8_BRACR|nr:hypothetical protein F2Q70_00032478 [Brassica cretica]